MANSSSFLESNLPASIDIEEMIVGRFTTRQLIYLCIGSAVVYNCIFKIHSHYIGWTLGAIAGVLTFLLGFYKMKKYDMDLSGYVICYLRYKQSQQLYMNKD